MNKNTKAFTLVELIVVITILAILGAIGFISLQGFALGARDSKRVSDVNNILKKISIEMVRGESISNLIIPVKTNTGLTIDGNNTSMSIQGTANFQALKENGNNFKDPITKQDYVLSYSVGGSGTGLYRFYQAATINEDKNNAVVLGNYFQMQSGDSPSIVKDDINQFVINGGINLPYALVSGGGGGNGEFSGITFTQIKMGTYHVCGITSVGGVKCWGQNTYGQLGDGTNVNKNIPTDVTNLSSGVQKIATDGNLTCALLDTGGVKCWGRNSYGQIGDGTTVNKNIPTDVSGLISGVQDIVTKGWYTCALLNTGGLKCWGYNYNGELGDGTTVNKNIPTDVSGLSSGISKVYLSEADTCVLLTTGGVKCWGQNDFGQLGDGTNINRNIPTDVLGLSSGVQDIMKSQFHTCALLNTGGLKCWGGNWNGQLGDGTNVDKNVPTDVVGLSSGVSIIYGTDDYNEDHTCALLTGGGVKCWGYNWYGQLGDGTNVDRNIPTDVLGLNSGVSKMYLKEYYTCSLLTTGGVKCWGNNSDGQLGDGTNVNKNVPTDVSGLNSGVQNITTNGYGTCVLLTDGLVKCWGYNGTGRLGNGTNTDSNIPVSVLLD